MSSSPLIEHLSMSLKTCTKAWLLLYICTVLLFGILSSVMFHLIMVGALLVLLSYFRLPPVDPSLAFRVLGADPRNYDGSPSKRNDLGIIAHRAAGLDGPPPENTLEAVRAAKANGAKVVEFDIAFSSDGVAVVFHDDLIDRLAINGKGYIEKMTYAEISKLRLRNKLMEGEEADQSFRIPTVDEFVKECLDLGLKMIVDLKSYTEPEKSTKLVFDLYKRYPEMYKNSVVSSFFPHLIYMIRSRDEQIVCAMAWRPHFWAYESYTGNLAELRPRYDSFLTHISLVAFDVIYEWAFHDFIWYFLGLSAVLIHKGVLTQGYVQRWRERGVRVIAWTVNNSLERAYLIKCLRVTSMSDTLDTVPLQKVLTANGDDEDDDYDDL